MKKTLLVLLCFLIHVALQSQDSIHQRSWSLNGYLKDMQNVIFYDVNDPWITGNLLHNRLNFKWNVSTSVTTAIEMRNRFFFGDMMTYIPDYARSFEYDEGLLKLSWNIFTGKSYVLNTTIDRLWIDFSHDKFQGTLGRQRVNWGLNFVWNPNDIFNTYSYLDFDYEERPGSDAIRLQFYPGSTSRVELTGKATKDTRITAAGLYSFNRWSYDFQFLGGLFEGNDIVAGAGWAGQIAKGGFRGEISYFHPLKNILDTFGILVTSAGYDYTFKNSLLLQFEILYNGNENGNIATLLILDENSANAMSAKNPFLYGFSFFGGITYPFHPLFTGSFSGILNPDNKAYIIIPSGTFSVTNNIDLMLLAQVFEIYKTGIPVPNINFVYLRLKWSF